MPRCPIAGGATAPLPPWGVKYCTSPFVLLQEFGESLLPFSEQTALKSSPTYQVLYENLLYCLFVFLGPLLILIILNACLIQVLL